MTDHLSNTGLRIVFNYSRLHFLDPISHRTEAMYTRNSVEQVLAGYIHITVPIYIHSCFALTYSCCVARTHADTSFPYFLFVLSLFVLSLRRTAAISFRR
ncbi:hypothetical protein C8J57DRAFT_662065 [Mycena rebaudengoi]|nr:hypothetical protein C8J57DRAFT_662065 [Mycena rebaudengoi]